MAEPYVNLPGMLAVRVSRSLEDPNTVIIDQEHNDSDDEDEAYQVVLIHVSQVRPVMVALSKFLGECEGGSV